MPYSKGRGKSQRHTSGVYVHHPLSSRVCLPTATNMHHCGAVCQTDIPAEQEPQHHSARYDLPNRKGTFAIPTLQERRERPTKEYFQKILSDRNHKLKHVLLGKKDVSYSLRSPRRFATIKCKTDRPDPVRAEELTVSLKDFNALT